MSCCVQAMTYSPRRRPAHDVLYALFALALILARGAALPSPARAEACPGSGSAPTCPYISAAIVGQRAESILRFPEAVAVDGSGDVYVADQLSYVVQKFNSSGAYLGEWGSYGGGHGQFGPIGGLATDGAGNVYVVDSSHDRIEKFNSEGQFITAWGHRGSELGDFNFGSSQNYTQPPGGGIAVAGEYVYVADSGNNRIERFDLNGEEPIEWGEKGSEPGQLSYPRGVAANATEVLVADDDNHRIEKFTPGGEYEESVGSYGTGPGRFGFPYGIALDAAGDVYVADDINDRIVKLDPELGPAGEWGRPGSGSDQLAFPRALASDPAGDTYVADTANDRIEVFDSSGVYLRTIGTSARVPGAFVAPRGLAVDPTGRLFVSDTDGNRVEYFSQGGAAFLGSFTRAGGHESGFSEPSGIAIDPRGSIYVADTSNARVTRLWGEGAYLSELGGPADLGGAQLGGAGSVAVSAATGDLYVADTGHNRILVYSPTGVLMAKVGAGEGDGSPGDGPGELDRPAAVTVAPSGNVFVADTANNRIVELAPGGAFEEAFGQLGSADGRLHTPTGVAVDAAGRVYVVDGFNNRVEVFDEAGHYLEKWGLRGTGLGEFSQPTAVAVGCEGSVYVADTNNNRVERFDPAAPAGVGCLVPGAWPPPLNVAPVLHVELPRNRGILARGGLALSVSCRRNCKILITATLSAVSPRHPVALIAVARPLPAKLSGHVRLRVDPSALRRLRRALGRHTAMVATVRIVAVGPTGLRTTLTRSYSVTR
jgi:tripartite motif-containing protein 71